MATLRVGSQSSDGPPRRGHWTGREGQAFMAIVHLATPNACPNPKRTKLRTHQNVSKHHCLHVKLEQISDGRSNTRCLARPARCSPCRRAPRRARQHVWARQGLTLMSTSRIKFNSDETLATSSRSPSGADMSPSASGSSSPRRRRTTHPPRAWSRSGARATRTLLPRVQ